MKIRLEAKEFIRVSLLCCLILTVGNVRPVTGQDLPMDLTELSLEDLMQIELIPVGILGSHIHSRGEFMVGYRYMHMQMGEDDHLQDDGFMVVPKSMQMGMHMAEVMYGVTNNLTAMVMISYKHYSMDHEMLTGMRFTTTSEGIGDIEIMIHYALRRSVRNSLIVRAGVSLPTGSINQRDVTPAGPNQILPYPMQLGSGTTDLVTGLTYVHQQEAWSWGARGVSRVSLGRNENQYRFGNTYQINTWISKRWAEWLAPTLRVNGHVTQNVRGSDPRLNPNMVPTADATRQSDAHLSLMPMLNFLVPRGPLNDHRLILAGEFPIYNSPGGAPLQTKWQVTIAWQWTI